MVYSAEIREIVRTWAGAHNWGTAAARRVPAANVIPDEWVDGSAATRAQIRARIHGTIAALTNALFNSGLSELICVVIFENDCFGIASAPA